MITKLISLRNQTTSNEEGFTLIELMIVVVIIGILAAVAVPVYGAQQKGAVDARNKAALKQLTHAITLAKVKTSTPLKDITGSNCTGCNFNGVNPLTVGEDHPGWVRYKETLKRIGEASGLTDVRTLLAADGNPILIDEQEGEHGNCSLDWVGIYIPRADGTIQYAEREHITRIGHVTPGCLNAS